MVELQMGDRETWRVVLWCRDRVGVSGAGVEALFSHEAASKYQDSGPFALTSQTGRS